MGSPESRRKRKRTARATSSFVKQRDPSRISLPALSVLCSVVLMIGVGVRKVVRSGSASHDAAATRSGGISMRLAMLLQEQHEISPGAARYADPTGTCLARKREMGDPPYNLGAFTCVADVMFFVRALVLALNYRTVISVDVGTLSSPYGGDGSAPALSKTTAEQQLYLNLQGHISAEEEPPAVSASVIFVSVYEDMRQEDWSSLILKWLKATIAGGLVVIHSRVERSGRDWDFDRGSPNCDGCWQYRSGLREAVAALVCGENDVSAALGNFDGGLLLVRRAELGEALDTRGCVRAGSEARLVSGSGAVVDTPTTGPLPFQFEDLFLWATCDSPDGTIENVQAKFGGMKVIEDNARRRMHRSICFRPVVDGSQGSAKRKEEDGDAAIAGKTTEDESRKKSKNNSRKASRMKGSTGGTTTKKTDAPDGSPHGAVRSCLGEHLKSYPDDVRAVFAYETLVQADGGSRKKLAGARRLREMVLAKSGPAGQALWRTLHARSAARAAAVFNVL